MWKCNPNPHFSFRQRYPHAISNDPLRSHIYSTHKIKTLSISPTKERIIEPSWQGAQYFEFNNSILNAYTRHHRSIFTIVPQPIGRSDEQLHVRERYPSSSAAASSWNLTTAPGAVVTNARSLDYMDSWSLLSSVWVPLLAPIGKWSMSAAPGEGLISLKECGVYI